MPNKVLIRGGHIVNDDEAYDADILIEDGIITKIESVIDDVLDATVIDASERLIFPGGIDPQTHFQLSVGSAVSPDDFYYGTRAALAGGTTLIIDCVMPSKGESLTNAFTRWRGWADGNACCDYSFQVGINGFTNTTFNEMKTLSSNEGVNTFKLFLSAPQCEAWSIASDKDVFRCAEMCQQLGSLLSIHAEDGIYVEQKANEMFASGITGPEGHLHSRPEELEASAVYRAVAVASEAGVPVYIPSVMCKSAAKVIARFHAKGTAVFSETTVGALGASGRHVFNKCWRHSASHVTSPPLRPSYGTAGYLMQLLTNDDIQTVSSNHCTFNVNQKAVGKDDFRKIPRGVNGVEDRMSIVWQLGVVCGRMDICRFVAVTSSTAAKIFNIYPKKGRIAVGSDADLVIWNPNRTRVISYKTHHQKCDFNIFDGVICRGKVDQVIHNGKLVFAENGELNVAAGEGRFISLPCNSEYVYARLAESSKKKKPMVVDRVLDEKILKVNSNGVNENVENIIDTVNSSHSPSHCSSASVSTEDLLSCSSDLPDSPYLSNHRKRSITKIRQPPGGKSSPLW